MLSSEEKREMLEDAKSLRRKKDFRQGKAGDGKIISFDDYISFLDGVQTVFSPFKISSRRTVTRLNKL
ncbi:MAG: hypothetical protein WC592_08560 [Candidatus Omnitrophota bacterium]